MIIWSKGHESKTCKKFRYGDKGNGTSRKQQAGGNSGYSGTGYRAKRVIETGKVRISKRVREYEEVVDVPHLREEVMVDRVPVDQFIETQPEVRQKGDTTIIPVVEERYILQKQLVLVEELHVKKRTIEDHRPQTVKVLKEEVDIKRVAANENPR